MATWREIPLKISATTARSLATTLLSALSLIERSWRKTKKEHPKKDKKNYKRFHKNDKGLVTEGYWNQNESESDSESSDSEGPEVSILCLMAMEAPTKRHTINHQEIDINEVFDYSTDINESDLRTTLCDIISELHKYMKWF